ncbi:MAG: WD40 repeat domain-containing protein, partial [Alphaproteobacteria bacterium]|nr:WD40 repeat domain-containing protein [Alphaproteobacteria bacterium]
MTEPGLARRARLEIAGGAAVVIAILGFALYKWERPPESNATPVAGYAHTAPDSTTNTAAGAAKPSPGKGMIVHPSTTRPSTTRPPAIQPAQKQRFLTIPGLLKPLNLAPPPLLEYPRATERAPLTEAEILERRRVRALRLARFSREHTARRDAVTGALLALEALPDAKIAARPNALNNDDIRARNDIVQLAVYRALYAAYLHRREIGVLSGHFRYVRNAVYSHDGARLATVSSDRRTRLWDPRTGAKIALLKGHDGEVWDARFSPDDQFLATASFDGVIRIWNTNSGEEVAVLKGHEAEIASLDYSPDGRFLVSGSYDGAARIWNMETLAIHAVLRGHSAKIRSVAFSPGAGPLRVATAGDDGAARIWDATTGEELAVMRGHRHSIRRLAFSPDGKTLATASADKTARLWNVADGTSHAVLRGHESWVDFIAFSPDGAQVATASRDKTARLWN